MKSFKREMVLMMLPLLVIGVAALFLTKRQSERHARESGPYRTVVTRVETLSLSPLEAWRGFDRKIRLHFELQGQAPQHEGLTLRQWLWLADTPVVLSGTRGGKHAIIHSTYGGNEGGSSEEEAEGAVVALPSFSGTGQEQTLCLLLNTSSFQGEVKIEGHVKIQQGAQQKHPFVAPPAGFVLLSSGGTDIVPDVRPASFSVVVRHAGEPIAPAVDKTTPEVKALPGRLCSPQMQHRSSLEMDGDYQAVLQVTNRGDTTNRYTPVKFKQLELRDEKGALVKKENKDSWQLLDWDDFERQGYLTLACAARLADVPASRGSLWVRGFLSVRDSWPAPFSVQVRRREDVGRPVHLQLESVRVVTPGQVQVALHYSGGKTLETFSSVQASPYDVRDRSSVFAFKRDPGHDRLLSHWSEHLVTARGQENWDDVKATQVAKGANGKLLVTYSVNVHKALRIGQKATFKANVGLEDEGFIPIQCSIARLR